MFTGLGLSLGSHHAAQAERRSANTATAAASVTATAAADSTAAALANSTAAAAAYWLVFNKKLLLMININ